MVHFVLFRPEQHLEAGFRSTTGLAHLFGQQRLGKPLHPLRPALPFREQQVDDFALGFRPLLLRLCAPAFRRRNGCPASDGIRSRSRECLRRSGSCSCVPCACRLPAAWVHRDSCGLLLFRLVLGTYQVYMHSERGGFTSSAALFLLRGQAARGQKLQLWKSGPARNRSRQLDKSSRGMQHGETGRCDRKGDRSVFRKATDPVTSLQLARETGPRRRLLRRARQTGTGRPPTTRRAAR